MSDRFLIFDPASGEVSLSDHARNFNSFVALEKADTSKGRNLFRSQLKVLFYVFSPESSIYDRYTPEQRKEFVYKEIVSLTRKKVESEEFQICERMLIRHSMSREEAQFHQIQMDFDRLLDYLNSIAWEREVQEETISGKSRQIKTYKISNMDERLKAIRASKDILSLQKELETIVAGKRRASEQNTTRTRLFEDPNYMKLMDGGISN